MQSSKVEFGWRVVLLFPLLETYVRFRKRLNLTRKNLLFTKRLAFAAAKEISQGKGRAEEVRFIEIKTKELLEKEKKGLYTEKVRRKQLHEIEVLVDHYLGLLNSNRASFPEMIRTSYQSYKDYLSFLHKLHHAEQEVIQATLATMRRGTKKDRRGWFRKVMETCRQVRMEEAERIFPRDE